MQVPTYTHTELFSVLLPLWLQLVGKIKPTSILSLARREYDWSASTGCLKSELPFILHPAWL